MTNQAPSLISGYSPEQIGIIKNLISKDLTDNELSLFLMNCKRSGLDPFAKQIYAIKRKGQMTIQTSIDGYRVIAERTRRYSPGRDTEFFYDEKGKVTGAKVFVKKLAADGSWHEVSATAFMKEYEQSYNGAPAGLWGKMPHVMIEKCAEARALRRCFPAEMGGIYTKEEMGQAEDATELNEMEMESQPQENQEEVSLMVSPKQLDSLLKEIGSHQDIMKSLLANLKACGCNSLQDMDQNLYERARDYVKNKVELKNVSK